MLVPCIDCGELAEGTRCEDCAAKFEARRAAGMRDRLATAPAKTSAHKRGYNSRWTRLSRRARRLQPFCSDCGKTTDLQCDHTPEAWERHAAGLPIRLCDVDVVCGDCNRKRGAARGEHVTRPRRRS